MKTLKALLMTLCLVGAMHTEAKTAWTLPEDWDAEPTFETVEGYAIIRAEGAVRGIGEVGAPDLPVYNHVVAIPKGSTLRGLSYDVEWEKVPPIVQPSTSNLQPVIPSPVAQPVTAGQKLVYPAPGPQYAGTYPAEAVYAGEAMRSGDVTLQPIIITPFKWDGATKTLYVATKLQVEVEVEEARKAPKLTTSSADKTEGEVLILSPHDFVDLWKGYAAFRKGTDAGKNFTFTVVDTSTIYNDATYMTRASDYALALHHYIESQFYSASKCDKQYIILGASPAKTATFNPNTMIPKRDFFGDSGTSPHDYDQAGDMYYGCMERLKNGQIDPSVEVWDYGNDGVYWAAQNTAPYNFDPNNCVDWTMEIAVTRVPLLERSVEKLGDKTVEKTAAQMMDAFTNRIAWAESAAFETADRGKAYVGGNENEGNQKGGKDERYTGERTFFDGITNIFDPSRNGMITSDEWGPRDRAYNIMGKVQPQRDAKIIANNINNTDINGAYANRGDLATFYSHGDWREYGNLSASRAYQGGGFYAVYATSFSCMSGKYDTNGDGAGITNALCFGEAPIVAPVTEDGALVTLTSARDGWSGNFGTLSMYLDELFLKALYGLADGVPMNVAQAGKYAHNTYAASAKGTTSAHGSVLGHAILCGDPLIKVFMMPDREELTGYSRNLSVSTASSKSFTIDTDVAAARAAFSDAGNQTLTLEGAGKFRTTDALTVTNVANLVWSVAGGAGRNGITFVGQAGRLTLPGNAVRYFGPNLTNVGEISVTGGNVTLDFDTTACSFDRLTYINSEQIYTWDDGTANPNILRTRKEGFIPAAQTIPVVNSALKLQTINIGGGNAALKDTPLFYVTNGVLTVESNPYWGTEYFVRPTCLSNAKLFGEYVDFGLGRPDSNGYDIYVDGTSEIGGSTPIKVTGELRFHLEDAATTLTITNALANGHNGAAGSVVVSGVGKVVLATSPTLTGGMTIESGIALELPKIPLMSGGTITLESGAKLLLPEPSSSGIYNVYSGDAKIVLESGAKVCKASAPDTEIKGHFNGGNFVPDDAVIYWKATSGTWQDSASATTCWTNSSGLAVGFTNGQSVFFGPVASSVNVTSSGVTADYAEINAPGSSYAFTGSAIMANLLSITGGRAYVDQGASIGARTIEVTEGGTLQVHAQSRLNGIGNRTVKALKFIFTESRSDGNTERVAIQELRLFRGTTFFPMPTGTIIEDCAGNKIRITGYIGGDNWAHSYEWIKGTDGNESLRALIDGVLGNVNKWWASQSAAPTWFTVTFPSAQNAITGYNLRTADHAPRNPKSWTVQVSEDGTTFTKERAQSGVDFGSTGSWMGNDGTAKAYDLMTDSRGTLHVKKGGTLVSSGNAYVDVTFGEGAVLKLVGGNTSLFRPNGASYCLLNLPENGGVYVSAEGLSASSGNEVLYGYSLTDADVAKFTPADNVTLSLSGGNLYATVDNKKCGPFTATLSANASWTGLAWKDRYGASVTWDSSLQYSSTATASITVESLAAGGVTLNLNQSAAFGKLKLTGGSTETLTLSWSAACVPAVIDLTEYDGKVVLAPGSNLTSATEIIANENTEINGTGIAAKLTIGAGKKATVEYPWSGTKTVATGGTIAYDNDTSSSVLALGNLKVDGATVELAGTHTIDGSFAVNVDNTKIISSGTVSTESGDNEVILSNNAKSIFEVTDGELILQGRVRIRKDSVGKLILSGGEIKAAGNGFLYPGGGYGGNSMDFTITGGKFTAGYNPYSNMIACNAQVNISGGEFAPANLWYTSNGNKPTSDNTSTTLNNSGFAVNMTGGTFSAPAGVPNWLPINVTAGIANLGPQNAGMTTIRSRLTIEGGATLNITAGTINFAGSGALKGTGNLAIGSGATFTTAYGSLSNNVTVAAGGTLNLTGAALTESGITITEGTFSKADGATLQINGMPLDMTQWTIEGNRIVKRQSGQYGPLMSERWHQHNPYDDLAPVLEGQQAPCGCVATAAAQMFHHYAWPKRLNGVTTARTTYKDVGGGYSNLDLAINGYETFDYDAMTNTALVAGAYQAARFVIWCDALAQMQFNPRGVGSNTPFYWVSESSSYWYEKGYEVNPSTAGDCSALVKAEVAAGRPVQTTISGHQVVIDGWRASDGYFHVNWGQEDADPEKTTYYRMNGAWLGDWQIASLWIGLTPRILAQVAPLSAVSSSSVTLNWDFPAARTNEVSGFKIRDYACASAVSDYDVGEAMVLDRSSADYYPIPGAFVLTAGSDFSCSVESSYVLALDVVVQMRLNGGDWMDVATPELSRKESYWDKEVYIDNSLSTPVSTNLAAYAGQLAEFRFKTVRTGNTVVAPTSHPYLYVDDIAFTQVKAPGTPTERTLGADARSVTFDGLSVDSCHAFTVTPITNGNECVTSEAVSTRIAAAQPVLPEILGVTTMGSPMMDGFRRTCKPGGQVYFVQCSSDVTDLRVTCSHTTYAADSAFHVIKCEQPGYFVFYLEIPSLTSGSQMLYTIAASDANGNTVHRDLQVTVSQDATEDEEGWLINGLKQENVFIVPPGTETELPSDFNRPVVGSGTNTFHNAAPSAEQTIFLYSLQDWIAWHGTIKLVDCPKVENPNMYKNENSFLVEEKSPEPPGPTLDTMYTNTLNGGSIKVTVSAGTYGVLTVPGGGYFATTFDTKTTLGITESNTYADIIIKKGQDNDTRQHTFAGWFCASDLSAERILWFAYANDGIQRSDNGYKVCVTTEGKIKITKTSKDAQDNGTALVSQDVMMTAGKWAHIAVAFEWGGGGQGNRWLKPTLFVNGVQQTLTGGTTIGSNLNGNTGANVQIGADMKAAGIYVDRTALTAPTAIQYVATNENFVVRAPLSRPLLFFIK